MQMTWENLTKFFTWAAQHGSEVPLADTAGERLMGRLRKRTLLGSWPLTQSRRYDHREPEGLLPTGK
jgi:hypothetical protein